MSKYHPLTPDERAEAIKFLAEGPPEITQPLAKAYLQAWTPKDEHLVRVAINQARKKMEAHGRK